MKPSNPPPAAKLKLSIDRIHPAGDDSWIMPTVRRLHPQRSSVMPMGGHARLALTHDRFAPGSLVFEGIKIGLPKIRSSLKTLLETGSALELTSASLIKGEMDATMKTAVENSGRATEIG